MYRYIVKVKSEMESIFESILRFDREVHIELLDQTEETYEVTTRYNIERLLDVEDGVISYEYEYFCDHDQL